MTFYDILQFTNAFIALILGSFLVWLLSKGFRYKIWKYFFSIWKDILLVSLLASFVLMFIPFQFKQTVLAMLIVIYMLLFRLWGPNKVERKIALAKKGKIRRFITPKEGWIAMFFILVIVIILGRGELMIASGMEAMNDSKELLVNKSGDITYDYDGTGNYGVGLSDTNQDGNYDTVKYDINRDGIVDLLHKDTNKDFIIDEIEVIEYGSQRLWIHLFLLFSIIGISLWGINRRRLKWQLKDKGIEKEEDLKISQEDAEEYKRLKKESEQKMEEVNKKIKVIPGEKEIDLKVENRKFSKLFSGIVVTVFSFSTIFSPLVLAMSQSEMMMQMGQYEDCAKKPFDDNQCGGVPLEVRRYMQHITCTPKFRNESMDWGERLQVAGMYDSETEYQKAITEYQAWWNKWKSISPKDCTAVSSGSGEGSTGTTGEDGTTGNDGITGDDEIGEDKEIPPPKEKDDKFSWDGEGASFDNPEVKDLYDEAQKGGTPDIDYFKMLDEILKYEKATTTVSGKLLEGVNKLNKIENGAVALFKGLRLDRKQEILEKALDTLDSWRVEQIDVDDLFNDMAKVLKKVKRKKVENFEKYLENIGVEKGKFGKTLKVLDIFGKGVDIYADSKSFNKLLKGDPGKVLVAVTLTTAGKWVLGANPVDVTTGLIGGGFMLIGKDQRGEYISGISAGDIAKKTVEDAFTTTTEDFKNVVDYEKQESKKNWNDKEYNIVEKTGMQLNSVATVGYGVGVLGVQKVLEFNEPGISAFSEGVKEIGKWFK